MTKKDYKLIAGVLREFGLSIPTARPVFISVVYRFARAFERENPGFKMEEFLAAAGVDL